MKVVLFCGGQGIRLREYSETIPKPMVNIGYRPILWEVMKYYSSFGHNEFILCLGYKADVIKNYFINYDETVSNDFVYANGGKNIELISSDISNWKITFVDTGQSANIGMRLMKVREYLQDEEMFLANYSDGLTDLNLPDMINWFSKKKEKTAAFMVYQPSQSFHVVKRRRDGTVDEISPIGNSGLHLNTGYFIFRKEIFDNINYGEDLVEEPFKRMIQKKKLVSWEHKGFWASMDTFKDKKLLDDIYASGTPPWEVWRKAEERFDRQINEVTPFEHGPN
ncbi:glucose-1-phosphate cytidylyltransferase [Maribellus comscasis]|uniref:Glucose-1-phosphate cytidylyltransferase n=1 Tax=Maribellus comscasis TaxID=2681766 RepID=A0A6I6JS67_9BACT|nr:sugar phosphate nucleotidyltransferase [Maribellus comscasis]QGY43930.1 glucose-1-phosphate cytidylyltransferase [Maribellus comscasis]